MSLPQQSPTRQRLPNRRLAETFTFEVGGLSYVCTVGRFPDGRTAEVFLTNHRAGSDAGAAASDSAVVCSIALQYGVPVEVIRKALMRDSRGQARTPLAAALDRITDEGAP
jgi:ribonucleoside-diphosphate reductase alpha chain